MRAYLMRLLAPFSTWKHYRNRKLYTTDHGARGLRLASRAEIEDARDNADATFCFSSFSGSERNVELHKLRRLTTRDEDTVFDGELGESGEIWIDSCAMRGRSFLRIFDAFYELRQRFGDELTKIHNDSIWQRPA